MLVSCMSSLSLYLHPFFMLIVASPCIVPIPIVVDVEEPNKNRKFTVYKVGFNIPTIKNPNELYPGFIIAYELVDFRQCTEHQTTWFDCKIVGKNKLLVGVLSWPLRLLKDLESMKAFCAANGKPWMWNAMNEAKHKHFAIPESPCCVCLTGEPGELSTCSRSKVTSRRNY